MVAETWDGKSKYKMEESKLEEAERLQQWEKFLKEEADNEKEEESSEHGPGESEGKNEDGGDVQSIEEI